MLQLVSIIIPAYNAAKRIEATLLSIAAQDYENIEIIVVDDGSSDGTADAAEKALEGSGRAFKVIRHDVNKGLPAARNSGLSSASGDYVIFFDSDDLADPCFVSVLLNTITENDSDAAFCGYRHKFESTGEEQAVPLGLDPARKYSAEELTVMIIFHQTIQVVWTTIFKTSFLRAKGLEFAVGCKFSEDTEFLIKAFSRCGSINFTTGSHYVYVQHEDMIIRTSKQTPEKALTRYVHVTEAICRTARYLAEYAESPKVRKVARDFMLAEGLIKTMNIAARRRDKAKFYLTLNAPETRRALKASLRYLPKEPELLFKSIALLLAPRLYFWIRSKSLKTA